MEYYDLKANKRRITRYYHYHYDDTNACQAGSGDGKD